MHATNPTAPDTTISPIIIAYLHDNFRVSGKHLYKRYTTKAKPITSGHNYPILPTHLPPSIHRLTYATIAYVLHHTAPPPNPLLLTPPDAYEPFHIPMHARVVHRSYNSADFSKDNLVIKQHKNLRAGKH
jgi:hypothetical protein